MKILLTGAAGQVGNAIWLRLRDCHDVVATSRTQLPGSRVMDLRDQDQIVSLVRDVEPEIIIHPAAYTAVDRAEEEEPVAAAINCDAARILAAEAAQLSVPIVAFSTDYVFDGHGDRPWVEEDPVAPLGAYGRTKAAGEQAILSANSAHFILRTSWVVSATGHNFVKTMLRLGAERSSLAIVDDQWGAPASAALLASAVERILSYQGDGWNSRYGIYHLTCAGETTWYRLANFVFDHARRLGFALSVEDIRAVPTSEFPTPAPRPRNSRLDCRKFAETFAFEIPTWQHELRDVVSSLVAGSGKDLH